MLNTPSVSCTSFLTELDYIGLLRQSSQRKLIIDVVQQGRSIIVGSVRSTAALDSGDYHPLLGLTKGHG